MAGDKIHDDASGYQQRMRAALDTDGVTWHGGHSREEAMRLAASCDIGLSWRHPDLDASLELSTKVLEFGALGLPVILNRTPMHEALLGADYPLFAASLADVATAAAAAAAEPGLYRLAADRTGHAAERFTLDRAAERLRGYLAGAVPSRRTRRSPQTGEAGGPAGEAAGTGEAEATGEAASTGEAGLAPRLRVVVAGHDLKFFRPLLSYLRLQPDLEVRLDQWAALGKHDPAASRELAAWADVVVCEWCGPNAVWYSRHKRRGARLLVRLHRFELASPYPGQLKIGAVNQVICVSKHYARLCRERTGWPDTKVATVPNALDVAQLDRPKLDGARFHLGLIGMVPSRKRLDLALDVLEELRREDDRYLLFIKSGMPWEHWWVWQNPAERDHYAHALRRVQRSPLLRGAVVFDDAGPDVAAWLRRVGFVLSTSDDESFHVAPAEGMASRAVPVLRHWPGAETIYDMRWIHRVRPRWLPRSWRSGTRATGVRRVTTRTGRRPPRSTCRGCPRPGGACSPRTWTRRCPARSSSCSVPADRHVLHPGHQRGHRRRGAPRWSAAPATPIRGSCRSPARRRSPGVHPTSAPPCCAGRGDPGPVR